MQSAPLSQGRWKRPSEDRAPPPPPEGGVPERVTIFTDAQAAIRRMASDEPGPGQQYALQARKHIAALRRAKPGIIIEIRWCPAHRGIAGNEKADEWAKIAAEEPDTRGVEWLSYSGRTEARPMPLPRSLVSLKREISEKKWAEARQWAGGRTSKKKYRMPDGQKPDGAVANSTKRLASRFYQLKTGHCLTGQYLNWTKRRLTPQCWWCRYRTQTRDHLLKECPEWKPQQKTLWAEVKKATGRWKDRWKARDLLADVECSRAVLDFLSSTDVGRRVPAEAEEDAVSAVSELEVREWMEEHGAGTEEPGAGGEPPAFPAHTRLHGVRRNGLGGAFLRSFLGPSRSLFFLSFVIPLVRITSSWDRPGRRAKGCLQRAATARTADRKRTVYILAMISIGRMRVMNKPKKKGSQVNPDTTSPSGQQKSDVVRTRTLKMSITFCFLRLLVDLSKRYHFKPNLVRNSSMASSISRS